MSRKRHRKHTPRSADIERLPAQQANDVWCFNVVHDRTEQGTKLKLLTVLDEYTRECLKSRVEKKMDSQQVLETLAEPITERGSPRYTWSDTGPKCIGKLLDECLNEELFWSRAEAQVVVDWWRRVYNTGRPHRALQFQTPPEVAEALQTGAQN